MKTIKVMRDGRPATAQELQCAVDDKPLPPVSGSVIVALIAVARAANALCDGTSEDSAGVLTCSPEDFRALDAALSVLDDWPDPPGESATGPRKAEYWLSPNEKRGPTD